jgi:hypothetical protein
MMTWLFERESYGEMSNEPPMKGDWNIAFSLE